MGLLTYDPPTLGTVGSQPATDIVDALDEIKAEANGSVETANLADGAADSIVPITRQQYTETSRSLPKDTLTTITTIPAVDGLLAVDLRFTVTVTSSGSGTIAALLKNPLGQQITLALSTASTTPKTIFTCPGAQGGVVPGTGAPVVFPGESVAYTLYMYAFTHNVSITNLTFTVDQYKDF